MKKKPALWLSCILLALVLAGIFLWPSTRGPITYTQASAREIESLKESGTEASVPFFTGLLFSGEQLPYDAQTSTFYLPLDMETAAWETGELSSADGAVTLLFEDAITESDKQEAIRQGTAFHFYAVKGGVYQACSLIVTGLSVISIETEATADAEVFGGSAYFWDCTTKKDWTSSSILEAHIRGNTSRVYPKKGYKLTLKKQDRDGSLVADKKSLFGLRTDDEWILNAMYSDSSKIRDKLCADIWQEIGAQQSEFPESYFGTRMTYVEVFFNHEYWGLYALAEPVDSKQLDLTKETDAGTTEYSYKSVTPQSLSTEELLNQESYGETLDGYELKGSHSSIDKSSWQQLLSYLELRDLSSDEVFAEEAPQLVDCEGALDVWLYLQAVLGIDNRGKNMYYVSKNRGDTQKIYFAPWDMDLTWGDALSEAAASADVPWTVALYTPLYSERINWSFGDRLVELDVDGAQEYLRSRYQELREGVLSDESLTAAIDDLEHQVRDSGALARNEARWPESNSGQDYELFKRMALYRLAFLDYYLDGHLTEYLGLGYE